MRQEFLSNSTLQFAVGRRIAYLLCRARTALQRERVVPPMAKPAVVETLTNVVILFETQALVTLALGMIKPRVDLLVLFDPGWNTPTFRSDMTDTGVQKSLLIWLSCLTLLPDCERSRGLVSLE